MGNVILQTSQNQGSRQQHLCQSGGSCIILVLRSTFPTCTPTNFGSVKSSYATSTLPQSSSSQTRTRRVTFPHLVTSISSISTTRRDQQPSTHLFFPSRSYLSQLLTPHNDVRLHKHGRSSRPCHCTHNCQHWRQRQPCRQLAVCEGLSRQQ